MDKTQQDHLIRQTREYTWNFDTQKPCLKVKYINADAGESIKGELIKFDTATDYAVILTGIDEQECIGIWAQGGIKTGKEGYIIVSGSALVMLEDASLSVHGNWVRTSGTAGRADASNAAPPGGGVVQIDQHMQEIGHCCESQGAGTDVLAECILHFN